MEGFSKEDAEHLHETGMEFMAIVSAKVLNLPYKEMPEENIEKEADEKIRIMGQEVFGKAYLKAILEAFVDSSQKALGIAGFSSEMQRINRYNQMLSLQCVLIEMLEEAPKPLMLTTLKAQKL